MTSRLHARSGGKAATTGVATTALPSGLTEGAVRLSAIIAQASGRGLASRPQGA
jgi:hypothetical protein